MDLSRGQILLRGHDTIPRCPHKVSNGFPRARLVYPMCVCYPLSVRLSALLPHMCGSLAMSRAATSAQCHRDCFVRPLTGATRPSLVAVQTTRLAYIFLQIHTSNLIPFSLILFIQAHPDPIVHPHPQRHASSSSTPSPAPVHAACNDLRLSRLSAQAAASQPTVWHWLVHVISGQHLCLDLMLKVRNPNGPRFGAVTTV
jgi:hypothetical protein